MEYTKWMYDKHKISLKTVRTGCRNMALKIDNTKIQVIIEFVTGNFQAKFQLHIPFYCGKFLAKILTDGHGQSIDQYC